MVSSISLWSTILVAASTFAAPIDSNASSPGSFSVSLMGSLRQGSERSDVSMKPLGNDWIANVNLGGQVLRVLVDTGSADLWTLSDFIPASARGQYSGDRLYNASKSKTWKRLPGQTFFVAYADGGPQVGGPEGTEHVTLGAANVNMPIGAANHTQELIGANSAFDGIIGLAFRRPNADGSVPRPTFMEAVQHKLDKPVFTCDLHRSAASSITFGSVDNSKFKGSLTELTVNNKTAASWLVDGVTFSAGGKSLGSAASSVLFDTGGLGTRLSSAQAKAYWAQVNGSQNSASNGYVFPCANKTPDLTFKFKAGPAVVSGATLNPTSNKVSGSSTMCIGGVQAQSGVVNAGDAFFDTFFTVFNQAKPSLSFAPYA